MEDSNGTYLSWRTKRGNGGHVQMGRGIDTSDLFTSLFSLSRFLPMSPALCFCSTISGPSNVMPTMDYSHWVSFGMVVARIHRPNYSEYFHIHARGRFMMIHMPTEISTGFHWYNTELLQQTSQTQVGWMIDSISLIADDYLESINAANEPFGITIVNEGMERAAVVIVHLGFVVKAMEFLSNGRGWQPMPYL